jgi:hypothetical protein
MKLKVSTIPRRRLAIGLAHAHAGFEPAPVIPASLMGHAVTQARL